MTSYQLTRAIAKWACHNSIVLDEKTAVVEVGDLLAEITRLTGLRPDVILRWMAQETGKIEAAKPKPSWWRLFWQRISHKEE